MSEQNDTPLKRFHLFVDTDYGNDLIGSFATASDADAALMKTQEGNAAELYEAMSDGTLVHTRNYMLKDDQGYPPSAYGIPVTGDREQDMKDFHNIKRHARTKCHWEYYVVADMPDAPWITVEAKDGE